MVTESPRASRMDASDAAAMPLPSEDTTPPVTKIRGVMKFSRAGNRHFSGISVPPRGIKANYWRKIQLTRPNAARRPPARGRWTRSGLLIFSDEPARHDPPGRLARRHAAARHCRRARPQRRPAPVRIPACALAGTYLVVGLRRLGRHPRGHRERGGAVDRFALFLAGGAATGRQRDRVDERTRGGRARPPLLAAAATAARRRAGRGWRQHFH